MNKLRHFIIIVTLLGAAVQSQGQDFGLSFSYFIPRHGEFSTPISPFSIRGVGIDLTRVIALETGVSLYRMSGLNLKDLPFESNKALLGPNFTVFIPAELVFQFRGSKAEFDIKGGGFFFYGFDNRINYGNLDRALRAWQGWQVVDSDVSFKNHPGFGYHAGFEFTVYVTSQFGISLEGNYLIGQAKFPLTGSYTGGNDSFTTLPIDYGDSKIDFTGMEFSIGLIFAQGGGGGAPKKKKRR